jgi:hypothetical protein
VGQDHQISTLTSADGVTIWGGFGNQIQPKHAAGTSTILNHYLLAKTF